MEGRDSYLGFKSCHYTHVHDLPPQLGGCVQGGHGAAVLLSGCCDPMWQWLID